VHNTRSQEGKRAHSSAVEISSARPEALFTDWREVVWGSLISSMNHAGARAISGASLPP